MTTAKEILLSGVTQKTTHPIQYFDIWDYYKRAVGLFWNVEEIDMSRDKQHWDVLPENEKKFLKHILAFFGVADSFVGDNIIERFLIEIVPHEAKSFYKFQAHMENVHAEMYSILIDTFITDNEEREQILNSIETMPCIKKKIDWISKWITSNECFGERLLAFAITEGIFFSGSFAAIFWLKCRDGNFPGLIGSNEFIARDEGLHRNFACLLFNNYLNSRPSDKRIIEIIKEAVAVEYEFFTTILPNDLNGMNIGLMYDYIKYVADSLLTEIKCDKIFNTPCPFEFMTLMSTEMKTNHFEKRQTVYQTFGLNTFSKLKNSALSFNEEHF